MAIYGTMNGETDAISARSQCKEKTVAKTKQSGEARVLDSSSSSSSSGIRPAQTDAVAMTWQLGETKWDEKFWGQETNDA